MKLITFVNAKHLQLSYYRYILLKRQNFCLKKLNKTLGTREMLVKLPTYEICVHNYELTLSQTSPDFLVSTAEGV